MATTHWVMTISAIPRVSIGLGVVRLAHLEAARTTWTPLCVPGVLGTDETDETGTAFNHAVQAVPYIPDWMEDVITPTKSGQQKD